MCFDGKYYLDRSLAFGAVNGTVIFQHLSDAIRKILLSENIKIWNYIDNIFACVPAPRVDGMFDRVEQVIQELGLPINYDKIVRPVDNIIYMGIEVNAKQRTVRMPTGKMNEILIKYENFSTKKVITRRKVQLLLGKLLYVTKAVIPGKGFCELDALVLEKSIWPFYKAC